MSDQPDHGYLFFVLGACLLFVFYSGGHCFQLSCLRNGLLESVSAGQEALTAFWKKQKKLGLLDTPFWRSFRWQDELPIPWAVHGDGAPYSELDTLKVVSMRCLLTNVQVEHSQLLLACSPK